MVMCMVMVMTYCFVPVLYYGFVHGYCSRMAKQDQPQLPPQSLYTPAIPRALTIPWLALFHAMSHDMSHLLPRDLDPSGSL